MNANKIAKVCGLVSVSALALIASTGNSTIEAKHFSSSHVSSHLAGPKNNSDLTPVGQKDFSHIEVDFVMSLKWRHPNELKQLILDQANPASPHYQKYLTVKEFTKEFGPSHVDYFTAIDFLTKNGLTLVDTSSNRLLIEGEGRISQLNKVFGSVSGVYQANGKTIYKTVDQPKIPGQLKNFVNAIMLFQNGANSHNYLAGKINTTSVAPKGYGPYQLATAYNYPNINNLNAGKIYSGRGVTVAIATAQSYNCSDVTGYWNHYGIIRTGSITNVAIGGISHTANPETTLDIEQIGSDAPGANIIVYEARNPGSLDFALMFNRIVTDNKAQVISTSWGDAENFTDPSQIATENEIFEEAAVQGQAVFAASGDSGAYDESDPGFPLSILSVDFPACSPYVVAVGATKLVLNNVTYLRQDETAWSGSGGGVSDIFSRPVWQVGPGVPDNEHRDSTDVSMDGDPNTGMPILYKNKWIEAGGTSFAAPNWAAGWSLAVEAVHHRIGMPDLYLYKIGASKDYSRIFYDVTQGNNGDYGVGPGYNSGVGYDHPTGWGTPNMSKLIRWLVEHQS